MSFYEHHALICCNQRDEGQTCCNALGASKLLEYAKDKVKALGLTQENRVRVNKSGCLGRCDHGPLMVIYPEAVWYTFVDESDIDEIISEHLQNGRIVERLQVPNN